jgi:hypothetical protein
MGAASIAMNANVASSVAARMPRVLAVFTVSSFDGLGGVDAS